MTTVRWLTPAPLWGDAGSNGNSVVDVHRPWLAEFASDEFVDDFLKLMAGEVPGRHPASLRTLKPAGPKLFQPFHQRYYLVTGSLVCRQPGLPDRTVAVDRGHQTSFVVRRQQDKRPEQAWVVTQGVGGWQDAPADGVLPREERLPLHPAEACLPVEPLPGKRPSCRRRTVRYGYLPVGNREKYLTPMSPQQALDAVKTPPAGGVGVNFLDADQRLAEAATRVITPWRALFLDTVTNASLPGGQQPASREQQIRDTKAETYILLDLADFLGRYLDDVLAALPTGAGLAGAKRALADELEGIRLGDAGAQTLAAALRELKANASFDEFVSGLENPPDKVYSLLTATLPAPPPATQRPLVRSVAASYLGAETTGTLLQLFRAALAEGGKPYAVPDEIADVLKQEPAGGDLFVVRLVYEHPPCATVISHPSEPFRLAGVFDPDAPARPLRIELPDIANLRRFKRGVGMQMAPALRSTMSRVGTGMLKGEGLAGADPQLQLGMICSFSIPIITLCAFIVLFIFLILFNIIFWWLPFIRICFPIPRRS